MTLEEIKEYLEFKIVNYTSDVFENDGIPMHLAIPGILFQVIKDYDGYKNEAIVVHLDRINKDILDEIIIDIEENLLQKELSEVLIDVENIERTIVEIIENEIYWKIADVVDTPKE